MWAGKRDSGVLEPYVVPFVGKNKPKTMHNVVFCDQSDVLTRLRSLTIESVLCQKISLINHTSQQKVFRIRKTKFFFRHHKIFPTEKKNFFLHMSAPKMQIKPEF